MNLLETLVAFVSTALIARPAPEPEAGVKVLDEMRRTMHTRFTALHREIDALNIENRHLASENVRLRMERDRAVGLYAGLALPNQWGPSPFEGLQQTGEHFAQQAPSSPGMKALAELQLVQARAQQNNPAIASMGLLNGLANLGTETSEWRHCTCVPGRSAVLREQFPRGFDGA